MGFNNRIPTRGLRNSRSENAKPEPGSSICRGAQPLPHDAVSGAAQLAEVLEFSTKRSTRSNNTLTQTERSIINCLMQGWPDRKISRQLAITLYAVRKSIRVIYKKLGVANRLELLLYACHDRLDLFA